jgi:hypothetical protein
MNLRGAILGLLLGALIFVPIALCLQWAVPGDGPYEYAVTFGSVIGLGVGMALAGRVGAKVVLHTSLLLLFVLTQVWLYVPRVSRNVGPWKPLRAELMSKSTEVEEFRRASGIPSDRVLTRHEVALLQEALFDPPPTFTFPFPRREVRIRILTAEPPYVGVDYGRGRNCVFDLRSMHATYCD